MGSAAVDILLFSVCAVFVIALSFFLLRLLRAMSRPPAHRIIGTAVLAVGAAGTAWISWVTVYPPEPVAKADLSPNDGALDFDMPDERLLVLVHGNVPAAA